MAGKKDREKARIKGIKASQTAILARKRDEGIFYNLFKEENNLSAPTPKPAKKPSLFKKAAHKAWDNKYELIFGCIGGGSTRAILTYFAVSASLTTGPVGILSTAVIGAGAGVITSVIKDGISVYRGKKEKKGWFKRALLRGVAYGALGGVVGGALSHWDVASEFIKDNVSESLGQKMAVVGSFVSENLHKGTAALASIFSVNEAVAASAKTFAEPHITSGKDVFRNFVAEKYGNIAQSFKKTAANILDPEKTYKPALSKTAQAAKKALHYVTPETNIPQETLDAVARKSAAAAKKAAAAARYLLLPDRFRHLVPQDVFDMMPENIREEFVKKYSGKLGAKKTITMLSDAGYYLMNKSFKSFGQMPVSARKATLNLFRAAATIARDNNLTDTKIGRLVNGNLSYMLRSGIGTAKNLYQAGVHALLGEGSVAGDQTIAIMKEKAPGILKKVAAKMPDFKLLLKMRYASKLVAG